MTLWQSSDRRRIWGALAATFLFILPTVTNAQPASSARPLLTLIGDLFYPHPIALPPAGILEMSLHDGPEQVLARLRVELEGRQAPLPFRLTVPMDEIDRHKPYRLTARIRSASGELLWVAEKIVKIDPDTNPGHLGQIELTQSP